MKIPTQVDSALRCADGQHVAPPHLTTHALCHAIRRATVALNGASHVDLKLRLQLARAFAECELCRAARRRGPALARSATMLDTLIPLPRKIELHAVDLAAPPSAVWDYVRHGDLCDSPLARALFGLRTLPSRLVGGPSEPLRLRVDDFRSSVERPGFQLLSEDPPRELAVGAIGKVWQLDIPFVHVEGTEAYTEFAEPGYVKVAWAIRVAPWGEQTRLEFELRVDATDAASWAKFLRYWRVIGPGSHFVRHALLAGLARRFGAPGEREELRALPGDALLPDAQEQLTFGRTIHAGAEDIWPWLLQMGCRRGGFYALDLLDNGGAPSARELHPELQRLAVGDVIPVTPAGEDGFEVLLVDAGRTLVLGGLFDVDASAQLPFAYARPARFWQITWVFELESLGPQTTRLHVRARAAFTTSERLHAAWIRPVHRLMQTVQLHRLAARAEGTLGRDTLPDVGDGIAGTAIMTLALLTPFFRPSRNHWGLSEEEARDARPGDELIPNPRWGWTHAVELEAPPERVWPWIAQMGADRGGFYSYQWLENLAGCDLHNAEAVHSAWAHQPGDGLSLHPGLPPMQVVSVVPTRSLVAFAEPDAAAQSEGRPWASASWAFLLEPIGSGRCRVVSRFRTACSDDLATRLMRGPVLLEPVGFAMDRRMLLGIRDRVVQARAAADLR